MGEAGRLPHFVSAALRPVKEWTHGLYGTFDKGIPHKAALHEGRAGSARIALRTRAAGLLRCGLSVAAGREGAFGPRGQGRAGPGPGHARAGDALPRHPGGGLRGPVPGRVPVKRNPGRAVSGHPRRRARRHAPRRRKDRPWAAQVQKEKDRRCLRRGALHAHRRGRARRQELPDEVLRRGGLGRGAHGQMRAVFVPGGQSSGDKKARGNGHRARIRLGAHAGARARCRHGRPLRLARGAGAAR